jgi:hypothetical protein
MSWGVYSSLTGDQKYIILNFWQMDRVKVSAWVVSIEQIVLITIQ